MTTVKSHTRRTKYGVTTVKRHGRTSPKYKQSPTISRELIKAEKIDSSIKYDASLAGEIIYRSKGLGSFWFMLHKKRESADAKVARLNTILRGTGATASVQFAANYNPRGIEWGSHIRNFSDMAEKKLHKKYAIKY